MRYLAILGLCVVVCCLVYFFVLPCTTIVAEVPKVYPEVQQDQDGRYYIANKSGDKMYALARPPVYTYEPMISNIVGTKNGLAFDFTPKPICNLDAKLKGALDSNEIKDIRAEFRKNGMFLSNKLSITKNEKNWKLTDEDSRISFNIVDQEKNLEVSVRLDGVLHYGFIKLGDGKYVYPLFCTRPVPIVNNKAYIDITKLDGRHDFVDWKSKGFGILGYRVMREDGLIVYDGKISFRGTGPFQVGATIIAGPFVNCVTQDSVIISFDTNMELPATVILDNNGGTWESKSARIHEVSVTGLKPDQTYKYTVQVADYAESYQFKTAPLAGARKPFVFSYASDARAGVGGGERNIDGMNAYILKKVMAVNEHYKAVFFQFTGDLADGYRTSEQATWGQLQNWRRCIEPVAHYTPVYTGMGNHEALLHIFDDKSNYGVQIDKFPFDTDSAEACFAKLVVNPANGPASEDGAVYDPDPNGTDFPTYQENVFYYTYDNVCMIVLNTDYWFSPSQGKDSQFSGNLHGYIMDQQMRWLEQVLNKMEQDPNIDLVFATAHTPLFPNGGHKKDSMWYYGDNSVRPIVAGKPIAKGIIERRDELATMLMKSSKFIAFLAGDEHNYCRFLLTNKAQIYPDNWQSEKITQASYFRDMWQITNGAAGAPYAAQEVLPWTDHVQYFTVQYSVVLFFVDGKKVRMEVINPDTLDILDSAILKE